MTVTDALHVAEPFGLVATPEYVVVMVGDMMLKLRVVLTPMPLSIEREVTLLENPHASAMLCPRVIVVGFVVRIQTGGYVHVTPVWLVAAEF